MLQWTNGLALVSLVSLQDIVSCYWHLQCHSLTNSVTSQPMHTSCLTNTVCMYACINQSINGGTNYPAGERHGKCPSTVFNSTPSHRLTRPLTQSLTFSSPPQKPSQHGVTLRLRLPRWLLASSPSLYQKEATLYCLCGRHGPRTERTGLQGHGRCWVGSGQSWLPLARLSKRR